MLLLKKSKGYVFIAPLWGRVHVQEATLSGWTPGNERQVSNTKNYQQVHVVLKQHERCESHTKYGDTDCKKPLCKAHSMAQEQQIAYTVLTRSHFLIQIQGIISYFVPGKRHPRIANGKWIWKRTRPEMGKVIHTKYKRQQCAGVYTHVHTCRNIYKIDFRRARRWGKGNNQDTLLRVSQFWDGDKETG